MRRLLMLATLVALATGLTATAVTLAGDRSTDERADRAQRFERSGPGSERREARLARREGRRGLRGRRGHRGGHGMLRAQLLGGLADRLDVTPQRLREAAKGVKERTLARAVTRGTITAAQRAALEACGRDRSSCDRRAARPALRALRRDARQGDLAARKQELAEDLATELDTTPARVLEAVRAELVAKLDLAVTFGAVTAQGRTLALGCFDAPQSCDLAALRREVRMGHGRRGR